MLAQWHAIYMNTNAVDKLPQQLLHCKRIHLSFWVSAHFFRSWWLWREPNDIISSPKWLFIFRHERDNYTLSADLNVCFIHHFVGIFLARVLNCAQVFRRSATVIVKLPNYNAHKTQLLGRWSVTVYVLVELIDQFHARYTRYICENEKKKNNRVPVDVAIDLLHTRISINLRINCW